MKGFEKAFTLVEVSLFLALSGFLMIGLIVGANVSISRQRYNDTVNSFAEFLRGTYSDVLNVSNDKIPSSKEDGEDAGRTGKAVYGKLVVFGDPGTNAHTVYSYDVIGDAVNSSELTSSSVLENLQELNANVLDYSSTEHRNTFFKETSFILPWDGDLERGDGSLLHEALLIVRSPSSGSVSTFSVTFGPSATGPISFRAAAASTTNKTYLFSDLIRVYLSGDRTVSFCVDSPDNNYDKRRLVRINKNASNSSYVEVVGLDSDENTCLGKANSGNIPGED